METVTYQEWISQFKREWKQGQHVYVNGPTGSGKTFVCQDLSKLRDWLVVIATKKSDETLDECYKGYFKTDKWPVDFHIRKVLFWRKPKNIDDLQGVRTSIYGVLSDVFIVGGWSIYFDDIAFLSITLKMDNILRAMYTQVRSNHTSLIASGQRAFKYPVEVISQSTYVLLFDTRDERDIERIAHETGQNVTRLKYQVRQLKEHEFLFIRHKKEPILVQKRSI